MLRGKNVLLGVTGGIAAYKACELASALVKQHADVNVIMTKNAAEFVTPLTFDALTHNRTVTDTFDRQHSYEIEHISGGEGGCNHDRTGKRQCNRQTGKRSGR
jgi:phosphopantothenoylcysteine decarboxylase/phosphopantothenate--cysteine ligase